MFELLNLVKYGVATEAVYLVGLRIRERESYPDWRRWLVLRTGEPTFPASPGVAAKLVEEIEELAGKPLAELSRAELEPFERRMGDIMAERRAREVPDRDGTGQRILEELRREYGGWQAVA